MTREARCIRCLECIKACPQGAITFNGRKLITDHGKCCLCGQCVEVCCTAGREIVGYEKSVEEEVREVMRDRPFFEESGGGVTFSGGEPLMQAEFLCNLLQSFKIGDIHTTLDTCESVGFAKINKVTIRNYSA